MEDFKAIKATLIQISKEETRNDSKKKTKMKGRKHIVSEYSLIY